MQKRVVSKHPPYPVDYCIIWTYFTQEAYILLHAQNRLHIFEVSNSREKSVFANGGSFIVWG